MLLAWRSCCLSFIVYSVRRMFVYAVPFAIGEIGLIGTITHVITSARLGLGSRILWCVHVHQAICGNRLYVNDLSQSACEGVLARKLNLVRNVYEYSVVF